MVDLGIRRLPVVNRDNRLGGFDALGNVAFAGELDSAGVSLKAMAFSALSASILDDVRAIAAALRTRRAFDQLNTVSESCPKACRFE